MRVKLSIEDDSGRTYQGEIILNSLQSSKVATPVRQPRATTHKAGPDPTSPMEALKHLHLRGIFKSERSLEAVETELGKIDCNFPKSSLATALSRADFLTRRGSRRRYRWIQKYKAGA